MEELKNPIIYKITNKVNGKIYIGGSDSSLDERWKNHLKKVKQGFDYPLYKAIREYGEDSFSKETIEICKDLDELNEREIYWIAMLSATNPEIGYNVRAGGGIRKQSVQTRRKIGLIHKGKESEKRLPILQYDCEGNFLKEYPSITEAAKECNYSNYKILRGLSGKVSRPLANNQYMWFYKPEDGNIEIHKDPSKYYKDLSYKVSQSENFIETRKKYETTDGDMSKTSVAVAQYDLNGKLLNKFYSISEASRNTGVSQRTIRNFINDSNYYNNLKNKSKTNYIWKPCDKNDPDVKITKQDIINKVAKKKSRIIKAFDPQTWELVKQYNSTREFEKVEHADRRTMLQYANSEIIWNGYYWEIEE